MIADSWPYENAASYHSPILHSKRYAKYIPYNTVSCFVSVVCGLCCVACVLEVKNRLPTSNFKFTPISSMENTVAGGIRMRQYKADVVLSHERKNNIGKVCAVFFYSPKKLIDETGSGNSNEA